MTHQPNHLRRLVVLAMHKQNALPDLGNIWTWQQVFTYFDSFGQVEKVEKEIVKEIVAINSFNRFTKEHLKKGFGLAQALGLG